MKKIPYLDILKSLLPANEWESFLETYSKPLPKNFTIMRHRNIDEEIIHSYVDKLTRPGQHFLHQSGFFYIQEQAASLPAQVLLDNLSPLIKGEAKQGDLLVLDLCAAPGGKSIQLADALLQNGFIVSNEPIDPRRKALIFNINRTGCYNTMVTSYDGTKIGTLFPEAFDKILVDAPCSGEGMNYKIAIQQSRDEIKIKKIAATQYQLLKSAILACKKGGTIIYSTCTLNPIENEGVIANIIKDFSGKIELENIDIDNKSTGITSREGQLIIESNESSKLARFRPHKNKIGGFFIAKIRKIEKTDSSTKSSGITSQLNSSPPIQSEVRQHLEDEFGIQKNKDYFFLSTGNTIYLTSYIYEKLPDHIKNNAGKIGIPIYAIGRDNNRIPNHHLGNILGHLATKNFIELTDEQAQEYSDHKDIQIDNIGLGKFIILKRKNYGFSIGKIVDKKIKNKMI